MPEALHSSCMCQQHVVPHTPVVAGVHMPWGMHTEVIAQLQASSSAGSGSAPKMTFVCRQEATRLGLCLWVGFSPSCRPEAVMPQSLHMGSTPRCRGACA